MDDIDVLISNGTCYYGVGMVSSTNVIPCGNAANDFYSCCLAGDFCLESHFCYNSNYTTTYAAGCTDPDFVRSTCPVKGHSDQQLLGLVQCADTDNNKGQVLWSGCPGPATRTALGQPSVCDCTGTASGGLLYASTSLAAVGSLPERAGGTISFAEGYMPSRVTVAGGPVTESSGGGGGLSTGWITATSTSSLVGTGSYSDPQELSTGAKAGIGVGAAALGLAALGLVLWFSTWYRRKRTQKPEGDGSPDHATVPVQNGLASSSPMQHPVIGYYYPGKAGLTTGSVPPSYNSPEWPGYSGFKSELPADSERGFRSELPAEELLTESAAVGTERAPSPIGTPQPQLPSEPGSPGNRYLSAGTWTSISDVSSIVSGSPPTQPGQLHGNESIGGDTDDNRTQMTPISEVHEDIEDARVEMPVRNFE